jgi:uncharacterized protein YceH (UPF0502 family)
MPNAKKLTDDVIADLSSLDTLVTELLNLERLVRDATLRTRSNPAYVEDQHRDIVQRLDRLALRARADLTRLRQRVTEELPPMLERATRNHAAASLPQQVEHLTAHVAHLHQRLHAVESHLALEPSDTTVPVPIHTEFYR